MLRGDALRSTTERRFGRLVGSAAGTSACREGSAEEQTSERQQWRARATAACANAQEPRSVQVEGRAPAEEHGERAARHQPSSGLIFNRRQWSIFRPALTKDTRDQRLDQATSPSNGCGEARQAARKQGSTAGCRGPRPTTTKVTYGVMTGPSGHRPQSTVVYARSAGSRCKRS
jgi:hypothetical protein